ncbi:MAG: thiolase C-terminal domain-containing protein [Vicinamibacteria bacterium]
MLGVAIIGIGWSGFRPATPDLSYRELTYEAAVRAYRDARVEPKEIQSFVTCAEDFLEGTSIFDEYTPDQMGAVLKPMHTVTADGLFGIAAAVMQIETGLFELVAVEAHSKASNIETVDEVVRYALDPILTRPLGEHPHFVAGLEMQCYLHEGGSRKGGRYGGGRKACAAVVSKNRENAIDNPMASYGAVLSIDDVLASEPIFDPLTRADVAATTDGAVVVVLASKRYAEAHRDRAVAIEGIGWCSDSPSLENRDWESSNATREAARRAYRLAGIDNPEGAIGFAELDDSFSYKELQHLEALGLCRAGEAAALTLDGVTRRSGRIPVNPSGGCLGVGYALEAAGLQRIVEAVSQLRGEAGRRQLSLGNGRPSRALVHSWRGIPTTSCAVAVLARAGRA